MSHSDFNINKHIELLKEKVFQTETKWPHFELLFEDIDRLKENLDPKSNIVTMERGLLYGGFSLLAPIFTEHHFLGIDCSPQSANSRGAYNSPMVDDPRFIKHPIHSRANVEDTKLGSNTADLLMIPNLVHHIEDQHSMFQETARVLKPNGKLYIFEPLVREIHQAPDDFIRYTPYGLAKELTKYGYTILDTKENGGPFSVIAYCWAQALEYLPESKREEMSSWFYNEHMLELMKMDKEYPENMCRKFTRFPMAFSITAQLTNKQEIK